jgi:hypothetical protein
MNISRYKKYCTIKPHRGGIFVTLYEALLNAGWE